MPTKPLSKAVLQETVNVYAKHNNNATHASEELGIARETLNGRLRMANRQNITPGKGNPNPEDIQYVKQKLKRVELELGRAREARLDEQAVHNAILKLSEQALVEKSPDWVVTQPKKASHSPGIPTLFASDWHLGEIVDPSQIGGVNSYDMKIARARAKKLIETTIDLLRNHVVHPEYSGLVFALGGDMVSGSIHAELEATNESEIMLVVLELFSILSWCIDTLVDEFGRLFIPCVSGNHARITDKTRAKGRNYTNLDWLTYCFLAKKYENDSRISFMIPNGPDALFRIHNRTYLLTHGDGLGKGGDGVIGAIGPIVRGDHRKRSRNAQIDQSYDTLLCAHYHQLMMLERVIVNGSLVGYSEYANANNFGYEEPRQALWITHPTNGITITMPVNVGEKRKHEIKTEWVSWKGEK